MNKPIYLDYNATTPHDPEVIEAMLPYLKEYFGNPSSSHYYGQKTKEAVELARSQVAGLLNCRTEEVVFTSGGTESNNYALKGAAFSYRNKGKHIITTDIEHPAIMDVSIFLEMNGFDVTFIPVDFCGSVNISDIEKAITPGTILISVMHANNEVGTIEPLKEISEVARRHDVIFHTDAAQSAGKVPTEVGELGVDLLSVAGHKLYAPKGVGALYVREGIRLEKFIHGAGHENERRAGTENVLEIVGLGKACEVAKRDMEKNMAHMRNMRDRLHKGLAENLEGIKLNGHPENRLPNTLNISFEGTESPLVLNEIEDFLAVSAGAACHPGKISYVLQAMNVSPELCKSPIRFSTGKMTTEEEIDKAVHIISDAVKKLRK